MRKTLNLVVVAVLVALAASIGWLVFGETKTSEATHFNESIDMVSHQTQRMDTSLKSTSSVVAADVAAITSIQQLLDRWTPRYEQATLAYQRFDAAIRAAEQQAEAYFAEQRALTAGYHDDTRRAEREAGDEAEYGLYVEWRDRAHQVRSSAEAVVERLDDMDTDLQKLKLTTELAEAFDASAFEDVPLEIANLGAELSEFQIASDGIRAVTASPFQEGQ